METEISKRHVALLLVAIAVISVVGTTIVMTGMSGITGYSQARTGEANVTVANLTDISVTVSSVDFGNTYTGVENNTSDETPLPFALMNNGSVDVNISIKMNTSLFTQSDQCGGTVSNNSCTFRYKADNCTAAVCGDIELGCMDWDNSNTSWVNFTLEEVQYVSVLDYNDSTAQDNCDEVETDIQVWVPDDETTGLKSSEVTFTATQA